MDFRWVEEFSWELWKFGSFWKASIFLLELLPLMVWDLREGKSVIRNEACDAVKRTSLISVFWDFNFRLLTLVFFFFFWRGSKIIFSGTIRRARASSLISGFFFLALGWYVSFFSVWWRRKLFLTRSSLADRPTLLEDRVLSLGL